MNSSYRSFKNDENVFNHIQIRDDILFVSQFSKAGTEGDTQYYSYINVLQNWCKLSALEIHVNKTMGLVISRNKSDFIEGIETNT